MSSSSSSSSSSAPTPVDNDLCNQSLRNYCSIVNNSVVLTRQCKEEEKKCKQMTKQYTDVLTQFLSDQKVTCLPIQIPIDGQTQDYYLRLKTKTSQKSVNETSFKNVVSHLPTPQDLSFTYSEMKKPSATLAEVISQWVMNELYKQNTSHRTVFELSASKEKGFIGKTSAKKRKVGDDGKEVKIQALPHLPEDIVKAAHDLFTVQYNEKRLKEFKKQKVFTMNQEKKRYEPILHQYLSAKGESQQQKITITRDGELQPFFLKRVVKTKKPGSVTLAKSKQLVASSVLHAIKQARSGLENQPFNVQLYQTLLQHDSFPNLIFAEFCGQFSDYQKTNIRVSTDIVLQPERRKRSKKSESKGSVEAAVVGRGENHDDGEGDEDDEEDDGDSDDEEDDNN